MRRIPLALVIGSSSELRVRALLSLSRRPIGPDRRWNQQRNAPQIGPPPGVSVVGIRLPESVQKKCLYVGTAEVSEKHIWERTAVFFIQRTLFESRQHIAPEIFVKAIHVHEEHEETEAGEDELARYWTDPEMNDAGCPKEPPNGVATAAA